MRPEGTAADMDAAIAAARRAFDDTEWARDHGFRARCLRQLCDALQSHIEELREITVAEVGAPVMLTERSATRRPDRRSSLLGRSDRNLFMGTRSRARVTHGDSDPSPTAQGSRRRRRRNHTVELSAPDQFRQARSRPRSRQHHRSQTPAPGHALVRRAGSPR